jgi:hypothetical protein
LHRNFYRRLSALPRTLVAFRTPKGAFALKEPESVLPLRFALFRNRVSAIPPFGRTIRRSHRLPTIIPGFRVALRGFRHALFPKEGGARYLRLALAGALRPLSFSSISFLRPIPEGSLLRAFRFACRCLAYEVPRCPRRLSTTGPDGRVIRAKLQIRRYRRLGFLPR